MLKTKTPLLFLLLLSIIVLSLINNVQAVQLSNLGDYYYNGLTNYNPAYVIVFNKQTQQNDVLYVYAFNTTVNIWKVSDGSLYDSVGLNLPASILWGYGVFRYVGYGSLDGFWIVALCSNDAATSITAYLRVWFYNYTSKTCTQLSSDKSLTFWTNTSGWTCVNTGNAIIAWGNPIWRNNYEFIQWSAHAQTFDRGYNQWINTYFTGIMQLSNTQHLGTFTRVYQTQGARVNYYYPIISLTLPFDPNPSYIYGGNVFKQYDKSDPTFLYTKWDTSTSTYTVYTGNTYSYPTYTDIVYRMCDNKTMFKPIGFQYSIVSGKVYWSWYLGLAYNSLSLTKMQICQAIVLTDGTLQSPTSMTAYIINGICYNVDLRDPYTATSDTYFYHPNGYIFNVGYNSTTGIKTYIVDLGLSSTDIDLNVYLTGQQTFFRYIPSTKRVRLYILAQALPTVYNIPFQPPNKPTNPEEQTYPEQTITSLIGVVLPFAFLFIPALVLTYMVGKMGFVVGLIIGSVILVMSNLLPTWAIFLIGLGVIALIWSSMRRGSVE